MKEIKLTREMVTQVDDCDYDWLNQWPWMAYKIKDNYYAARILYKKRKYNGIVLMHRLIMGEPMGKMMDHKNRKTLINTRDNLRVATRSQNGANRKAVGASRYLGVHFYIDRHKKNPCTYIRASIKQNGKQVHLGNFNTEEEAALAYDNAAIKVHGEFANLNFKDYGRS